MVTLPRTTLSTSGLDRRITLWTRAVNSSMSNGFVT
jgi:hypothetical protein